MKNRRKGMKMKKYGNNDRYAIHVFNVLKEIDAWYYRATKRAAENVAEREHKKNGDGTICIVNDMEYDTTLYTYC